MPHRQVTSGTWSESRGQRRTFRIPGLLTVWRPGSHHDSRDQPGASPHPRRRSPLPNGEGHDLNDSYAHETFGREPRGSSTYEAGSPLDRPLLFDNWDRLRHSLSFEEESQYSRASVPLARNYVQPRYEEREPAWAREEEEQERREHYNPGTTSGFADLGPRFYGRQSYRPSDYNENGHQHEYRFSGPAPSASQYSYSHTAYPRPSPDDFDQRGSTAHSSTYESCGGRQGRSFDYGVLPSAPDPPSYSPATGRYDDARPWQPHVHVGGHAGRDRYSSRDGVDGSASHDNGYCCDDY